VNLNAAILEVVMGYIWALIGVFAGFMIGVFAGKAIEREWAKDAGVCLDCLTHRPCAVKKRQAKDAWHPLDRPVWDGQTPSGLV
jgi:hypothetical protein